MKIVPPEGYEVDVENSTFECIKFKPVSKYLTMEDVWDGIEEVSTTYYRSVSTIYPTDGSISVTANIKCPIKRFAKVAAYGALSDIAEYYNKGWKPDWNNVTEKKYVIHFCNVYKKYKDDLWCTSGTGEIFFKNKEDVHAVIDNPNFREILDTLYK